jgi:hypothetical protein
LEVFLQGEAQIGEEYARELGLEGNDMLDGLGLLHDFTFSRSNVSRVDFEFSGEAEQIQNALQILAELVKHLQRLLHLLRFKHQILINHTQILIQLNPQILLLLPLFNQTLNPILDILIKVPKHRSTLDLFRVLFLHKLRIFTDEQRWVDLWAVACFWEVDGVTVGDGELKALWVIGVAVAVLVGADEMAVGDLAESVVVHVFDEEIEHFLVLFLADVLARVDLFGF